MLQLKKLAPLVSGKLNFVYQHPSQPDRLIKILRLDKMRDRWLRKFHGIPVKPEFGFYVAWAREIRTYTMVCSRLASAKPPSFMPRHYGVIDTDLGLGLQVEKVTDPNGNLAPTVARVVENSGFTDDLRKKLSGLQHRIEELNIPTTDINRHNILMGWSEAYGDYLAVIEGFGENNLIPLKSMIPYVNRRSIRRHFARTVDRLEVISRTRRTVF